MTSPVTRELLAALDARKNAHYTEAYLEAEERIDAALFAFAREAHSRCCEDCPTRRLHTPGVELELADDHQDAYSDHFPDPDFVNDERASIARGIGCLPDEQERP